MIRQLLLVCVLAASAAWGLQDSARPDAPAAEQTRHAPMPVPTVPMPVTQVKTVYLLPMRTGFDQYLANHLSASGRLQVVTDPLRADVVMTDTLGPVFEKKLQELYAAERAEPQGAEDAKSQDNGGTSAAKPADDRRAMPRNTSSAGGRGNVFLVDPRAQGVVWSTFIRRRSSLPRDIDDAAEEVVKRFTATLKKSGASQ